MSRVAAVARTGIYHELAYVCARRETNAASAEQYVDTQIMATGGCKEACIIGKDDGALWATSSDEFRPRA